MPTPTQLINTQIATLVAQRDSLATSNNALILATQTQASQIIADANTQAQAIITAANITAANTINLANQEKSDSDQYVATQNSNIQSQTDILTGAQLKLTSDQSQLVSDRAEFEKKKLATLAAIQALHTNIASAITTASDNLDQSVALASNLNVTPS